MEGSYKMETKVRQSNYITILGWMVSELGLSGSALLIYAIIYGFSQNGDDSYTGSRQYLADWTNTTKRNVTKVLNVLVENGLIIKEEKEKNGVKFCSYKVVSQSSPWVKKVHGGGEKSSPNNIEYNTSNIYSAKFDKNDAFKRFWSVYPRHTNKKKAFDVFVKKCTDETVLQKMLSAVVDYKETEQWQNERFIPHASTWLNGERWEDEISTVSKNNTNDDNEWMSGYE